MMLNDPNEVVKARYVTSSIEPTKIYSTLNPTVDSIVNGDVINMSRREATERDDFVIVGEESTTTGAVAFGAGEAAPSNGTSEEGASDGSLTPSSEPTRDEEIE